MEGGGGGSYTCEGPSPSHRLLPAPKGPMTSQNRTKSWEPSMQTCDPGGGTSQSNPSASVPTVLAVLLTVVVNNRQRHPKEGRVYFGLRFEGIQSITEEKV